MFLAGEQKRIPIVFEEFWKDFEEFEAEIFDSTQVFEEFIDCWFALKPKKAI